jgi:hypothetical protein
MGLIQVSRGAAHRVVWLVVYLSCNEDLPMSPSTPLNGPTCRGTRWANYDVPSSVNSIYTVLFWYQCPKLSCLNRGRHPISDKS